MAELSIFEKSARRTSSVGSLSVSAVWPRPKDAPLPARAAPGWPPTRPAWRYGDTRCGWRVIDSGVVEVMTTAKPSEDGTLYYGHLDDFNNYTAVLFSWPSTHTAVTVLAPIGAGPDGH